MIQIIPLTTLWGYLHMSQEKKPDQPRESAAERIARVRAAKKEADDAAKEAEAFGIMKSSLAQQALVYRTGAEQHERNSANANVEALALTEEAQRVAAENLSQVARLEALAKEGKQFTRH